MLSFLASLHFWLVFVHFQIFFYIDVNFIVSWAIEKGLFVVFYFHTRDQLFIAASFLMCPLCDSSLVLLLANRVKLFEIGKLVWIDLALHD